MKSLFLLLGCGLSVFPRSAQAAPLAHTDSAIRWTIPEDAELGSRHYRDLTISPDLMAKGGFGFDISVSDVSAIGSFKCYFKSGKGWYYGAFRVCDNQIWESGKTYHVSLTTADLCGKEGKPSGWGAIDTVRWAAFSGSNDGAEITVTNVKAESPAREVVFLRAGVEAKSDDTAHLRNMNRSFHLLGITPIAVVEDDLTDSTLEGVRIVVLPFEPRLKSATCSALKKFVARGGKLWVAYDHPKEISELLDVSVTGFRRPGSGDEKWDGFMPNKTVLKGMPKFATQASPISLMVRPKGRTQIAAWWRMKNGRASDVPALVISPAGALLSHVWLGSDRADQLQFFAAIVGALYPEKAASVDAACAAFAKKEEQEQAELASMPARAAERRLMWCHSSKGLPFTSNWDEACAFARKNGFTDLIVNLAWAGSAFYESKVLPKAEKYSVDQLRACQAACHKHGLKFHVWKICWNQGEGSPKNFKESQIAAKRTTLSRKGELSDRWNCPTDSFNRQLEVQSFCELATKSGVDGVHFDYIRYADRNTCFCDRCRRAFENKWGRPIANWPKDIFGDKKLKAAWRDFRCETISSLVKEVSEKVRALNKKVEISAAVYANFELSPTKVGQDWIRWCREGWVDFVCPMDYNGNVEKFTETINRQQEVLKDTSVKLYPGIAIHCYSHPEVDTLTAAREIGAVRNLNLEGFTIFQQGPWTETVLPDLRMGPLKP